MRTRIHPKNTIENADISDINKMFTEAKPLIRTTHSLVYTGLWRGDKAAAKFLLIAADAQGNFIYNEEHVKLYFREVNIHSKLNHPNIVKYLGYWHVGINYIIATELLVCSLADYISDKDKKPLSYLSCSVLLAQIAAALNYLHAQDILHCDIKSANILLDNKDEKLIAKLADFGYAGHCDELVNATPNTPGYDAPELNYTGVTKETDIYSFGITMKELLKWGYINEKKWSRPLLTDCPEILTSVQEACVTPFLEDRPYIDEVEGALTEYIKQEEQRLTP